MMVYDENLSYIGEWFENKKQGNGKIQKGS